MIYYKCTSSTWSSIVGIQKAGKNQFFFAMLEINDLLLLKCELSQIYALLQLITELLTCAGHHCLHARLLKVFDKSLLHLQHLAFNKLGSLAPPVATAHL